AHRWSPGRLTATASPPPLSSLPLLLLSPLSSLPLILLSPLSSPALLPSSPPPLLPSPPLSSSTLNPPLFSLTPLCHVTLLSFPDLCECDVRAVALCVMCVLWLCVCVSV